MKLSPYILLAYVSFLCACSKKSTDSTEPSKPVDEQTSKLLWSQPKHPDLEVYLNQYKLSATQGAIGKPNLKKWNPNSNKTFTFSTNTEGKPTYSAELKYLGTLSGNDHYTIKLSYPVDSSIQTTVHEVIFDGSDIELFRDAEYRIGIRPRTPNKST